MHKRERPVKHLEELCNMNMWFYVELIFEAKEYEVKMQISQSVNTHEMTMSITFKIIIMK